MVNIKQSTIVQNRTHGYDGEELSQMYHMVEITDSEYDMLVISKTFASNIIGTMQHFDRDFTGKVVIDNLFAVGNNSNRFVTANVNNGVLDASSVTVLPLSRHDNLRELSNSLIRQDPEGLDAGVLLSHQKKLLLKGISI